MNLPESSGKTYVLANSTRALPHISGMDDSCDNIDDFPVNIDNAMDKLQNLTLKSNNLLRRTVCNRCGRENHDKMSCTASRTIFGFPLISKQSLSQIQQIECQRCGRYSHSEESCKFPTNIQGKRIREIPQGRLSNFYQSFQRNPCTRCGRDTHDEQECDSTSTIDGKRVNDISDEETSGSDPSSSEEDFY
jgi:hypothetical protein